MPNATGTIARKDFRAPSDAEIVRNMRNAGCILLGLTNTSECCIWIESRNPLYGVSRNPYNLSRIVGGSSGGEAALISSAASVIGIGSDIGGSIRVSINLCQFVSIIFFYQPKQPNSCLRYHHV
jgi:fatty acid amide hydrolase 2